MSFRYRVATACPYLILGVMFGCLPFLITIHLLPISDSELTYKDPIQNLQKRDTENIINKMEKTKNYVHKRAINMEYHNQQHKDNINEQQPHSEESEQTFSNQNGASMTYIAQQIKSKTIRTGARRQQEEGRQLLHQMNFRSLASNKALGFKKKLFTGVLSSESRVSKMSSAASMTWATGSDDVSFLYAVDESVNAKLDEGENGGTMSNSLIPVPSNQHNRQIQSVTYMCSSLREKYSWYVVISDTLYIDTKAVLSLVDTLYPDDNIVIGSNTDCNLDEGVIFSQVAMDSLCDVIDNCKQEPDFVQCVSQVMQSQCVQLSNVKETAISSTADSKPRHKRIEDDSQLFYPGMVEPQHVYTKHLQIMKKMIQNTKHRLAAIEDGLNIVSSKHDGKPKSTNFLQDWEGKVELTAFNTTRPSHKLIDTKTGTIIKDNCHSIPDIKPITVGAYQSAREVADGKVQAELEIASNNGHQSSCVPTFSYVQSISSQEMVYELYYAEGESSQQSGASGGLRRRVNHVTVGQQYGDLHIDNSHSANIKDSYIFTTVAVDGNLAGSGDIDSSSSLKELNGFLNTANHACAKMALFDVSCVLTILLQSQLKDHDSDITSFEHPLLAKVQKIIKDFEDGILRESPDEQLHVETTVIHVMDIDNYVKNITSKNSSNEAAFKREKVMIHIPVNLRFDHDFLLRCHVNTVKNQSAYFPVPFKLLVAQSPWVTRKEFTSKKGFWLSDHFTTFSIIFEDLPNLQNTTPESMYDTLTSINYHSKHITEYNMSSDYNFEEEVEPHFVTANRYPDPGIFVPWEEKDCHSAQFATKNSSCFKNFIHKNILSN